MSELKRTVLIMAGGHGERFWPSSRAKLPKQFLCLTDPDRSMIQLTVDRVRRYTNIENVYIATNRDYRELARKQIPDLPAENILCEPVGRNTAPCIALGAVHIAKKYGDAIMTVLPSDHLIKMPALFRDTLSAAAETAEAGRNIVTIGITPDEPETGYGYIQFQPDERLGRAYSVARFVEKPDLQTAKKYVDSGEYLWNSGMFTWKVSTILDNLNRFLPEMTEGLGKIRDAVGTEDYENVLEEEFGRFPSVSIDYGVMEKADRIYTLAGTFGWDDVGSWLAVSRIRSRDENGNTLDGKVIAIDTENSIIQGRDRLIAAVGISDAIVVDSGDAILICEKDRAGDIKKVLQAIRDRNMTDYL